MLFPRPTKLGTLGKAPLDGPVECRRNVSRAQLQLRTRAAICTFDVSRSRHLAAQAGSDCSDTILVLPMTGRYRRQ